MHAQPDPYDTLVAESASETARLAAAHELLRGEMDRDTQRRLARLLERDADPAIRQTLLRSISEAASAPDVFERPLTSLVSIGSVDQRPLVLSALATVGTPGAAAVLVEHAAPFMPAEITDSATVGLIRMTGRADLGHDHDSWREWFAEHEELNAEDWNAELVRGLRMRSEQLRTELDASVQSTADIYKRHFRVVPFQDRDGLLAEMLREEGSLRDLGIELLYREIASNRQIGEAVGEAALEILASPNVDTREEAARLIATLRPPEAGTRLTRALEIETEPAAAKALLDACSRWPRVSTVQPALKWLEFGSQTRDQACSLLFALDTEGLLTSPTDRRRVGTALRAAGPARLTPDGLRLLVLTGNENDREAVASLIDDRNAPTRGAAASALARRPEFAGRVIAAAAFDRSLYPAAVAATATHRATPGGYAALREVQAPTPEGQTAGLLAVARALSVEDALAVAQNYEPDPELRIAVLSTIGTAAGSPEERRLINESKLLLAETQLELGRPESAVASVAQVIISSDQQLQRSNEIRVIGLLWLNRIDEAETLDASAETWLGAIQRIGNEPHAPQVARAAIERFEGVLQDSERQQLESIAAIAQVTEPVTENDNGGG